MRNTKKKRGNLPDCVPASPKKSPMWMNLPLKFLRQSPQEWDIQQLKYASHKWMVEIFELPSHGEIDHNISQWTVCPLKPHWWTLIHGEHAYWAMHAMKPASSCLEVICWVFCGWHHCEEAGCGWWCNEQIWNGWSWVSVEVCQGSSQDFLQWVGLDIEHRWHRGSENDYVQCSHERQQCQFCARVL